VPVCADHIDRDAGEFSALALPYLGALSDEQCAAIWRFSARGGGVVATGATSLFNLKAAANLSFEQRSS
jgi:hypothetical protein